MDITESTFLQKIILVGVSREEDIVASFVTYSKNGGYDWVADADIDKLQLNRFPSILCYLQQHSCSNLELKFLRDEMISAELVSMQRDGGYKEPFQRVVEYCYKGHECLNKLSMQLQSEYQKNDDFEKRKYEKRI